MDLQRTGELVPRAGAVSGFFSDRSLYEEFTYVAPEPAAGE
jgi:hypothetical protein